MRGPKAGTWTALVAFAAMVMVTTLVAWAAWAAHDDTQQRILARRTREAGAVLAAAVPTVEIPLATAAALASTDPTDPTVPAGAFERAVAAQVGPERRFVSVSTFAPGADAPTQVIGEQPKLLSLPADDVRAALVVPGDAAFHVVPLLDGGDPRLGYVAPRPPGEPDALTVYAEQALPPDRTAVVQPDSAFTGLEYALYVGSEQRDDMLLFASTSDLPLDGRVASEPVALGDSSLLLVMSPTGELAGGLLPALPWIVIATGVVLGGAGSLLVGGLANGRRRAEALATENARLYEQQRDVAHTLQQSLLPRQLPDVEGIEVAARYLAGVVGTEVGGDWYDVLEVGGRLVAVVGDVSGRGVEAAAVMAGLRYSIRTLAAQGRSPAQVVDDVNALPAIERNGHFATVLAAVVDASTATATFVNAGHPPPLLVTTDGARFVEGPVGPPVGVVAGRHAEHQVQLPPDGMLLLVTDGLFERRGESVDVGLERLRATAAGIGLRPDAGTVLDELVDALGAAATDDDAVLLAVRWRS